MGKTTGIAWCDATFNSHWGCFKVSPGCANCYAETLSTRFGHNIWGPPKTTTRRLFGDKHWDEPLAWNRKARLEGTRLRVFSNSMSDLFEDHPLLPEVRTRFYALVEATPAIDWQLLTKRPENVMQMVPAHWRRTFPPNVWMGTSAEDQERADERIPHLMQIPARVRFLSCEPLLGPLSLVRFLKPVPGDPEIHWVIVGGESGPGARPMREQWVGDILAQCRHDGVAFFMKQAGAVLAREWGSASKAGEDEESFPEELRVREFPR